MDTSKSWLAPLLGDTRPFPRRNSRATSKESVWLPNEAVAKAWMEYVKTGAVGDTTPPPAPFNVRVWPKGAKGEAGSGNRLDAEADLESGIGGFIVLRDGQELAKVPQKPVGKFGRPLFQGMTYHDTPAQPLAEMRYLDTSAQAGKHVYEVVTVNSVGLKSPPSVKTAYPRVNYRFDTTMSREVLENYLGAPSRWRACSTAGATSTTTSACSRSTGAKFIGRSLCLWGGEANLLRNLERARAAGPESSTRPIRT